jgi:uncharacterized protein (TIGR03118 family)
MAVLALASGSAGLIAVATPAGAAATNRYNEVNLVANNKSAMIQDKNLVNAWGLAQGPTTPIWVSDNGTDKATLYTGDTVVGAPTKVPLTVTLPTTGPTGQVFNSAGAGFIITDGAGHFASSNFIFDSEGGDIVGWAFALPPPGPSTMGEVAVHVPGAVFKGLAMGTLAGGPVIYATDFAHKTVDIFDNFFHPVTIPGAFTDPKVPDDYSPFGIMASGGSVYVSYAKKAPGATDETHGVGFGFVDRYGPAGNLLGRIATRGKLNAPWGMAIAPSNFGKLSGALIVGNFGDGFITGFDAVTGAFAGRLNDALGNPMRVGGLWGLMFGNGASAATNTLLFSAGPNQESNGLFGAIIPSS